jgi:hypothetical protein
VCETLIKLGLAVRSAEAGSMLVMRKLADLPQNFSEVARKVQQS